MKKVIGIATRSRDDPGFQRLLQALEEQTERPPLHVVEGRTVAQARNAIAEHALEQGYDAVLFIDTDERPASDRWVREIGDFRDADIVAGPVVPVEVGSGGARYLAEVERALVVSIPEDPTAMLTGNSAWRTSVFAAVKERYGTVYDDALWSRRGRSPGLARISYGGEDWDLNLRVQALGFRVRFNPRAEVYHDYSAITWPVALIKRYRYSVGGALALLKNRQVARRLPTAARRATHPLDPPIKALALVRALLLYHGGI